MAEDPLIETRFMSDKIMPLSEAIEGYELFDQMKVQKGERFADRIAPAMSLTPILLVVFEAQK